MRGGNYEIEIKTVKGKETLPELPFLCTHNQRGTYCGKGLVIKNATTHGDEYTLVDLGDKSNGGCYNTVFSKESLSDLVRTANIKPRNGRIIIEEGEEL